MRPHAIVVGAGIAGLAAAAALVRAGYTVAIHERARALAPQGTALSLWDNAMTALERLDAAGPVVREAAPIQSLALLARTGGAMLGPVAVDRAWLPTRALLQATLLAAADGVPLHCGHEVAAVTQDTRRAVVTFADGAAAEADLAVIADGLRSPTATALLGNAPTERGYGGVLAISGAGADPPPSRATEYWGTRDRFGIFDVGGGCSYWFYMHPASQDTGPSLPDLLERARDWPAPVARAIAATAPDRVYPVTIAARPPPRRLGAGRVVCVGDAAHAIEPNLGQGAGLSLEDAAALAAVAATVAPDLVCTRLEALRRERLRALATAAARGGKAAHGNAVERALLRLPLRLMPAPLAAVAMRWSHRPAIG